MYFILIFFIAGASYYAAISFRKLFHSAMFICLVLCTLGFKTLFLQASMSDMLSRCTPSYLYAQVVSFENADSELLMVEPAKKIRSCVRHFERASSIMNYDGGFHLIHSLAPSLYRLTRPDWVVPIETVEILEPYVEFAEKADSILDKS